MRPQLLLGLIAASASLIGCATDGDIEDGENDEFLDADAKADAFGVEDWSPDGAAVLQLVSTASVSKLDNTVGLSNRIAKNIVAKRTTLGGKFDDLAQLDAVSYVGKAAFTQMLRYVTTHHLFKTSIRVPLLLDDGNGNLSPITNFNALARSFGVTGFARYTFVDNASPYSGKMESYDMRLQDLAAKANVTIDGEMLRYAAALWEISAGSQGPCFIGDPKEVADVSASHADDMMSDMYSVWGWRVGSKKWVDDSIGSDANAEFGSEWKNWDTSSEDVYIMSSSNDDGDLYTGSVIPPCR